MQEIVAADHLGVLIGKDGKAITGLGGQGTRRFRGVNADGHRVNASRFKFRQVLLYTS